MPEDILAFWFPPGLDADEATHARQFEWWFRGGSNEAIADRYAPVLEAASLGTLDHWAAAPRSRLALIIVLDQFSRALFAGTPQAYAQDGKALGLAVDGIERGHLDRLGTVWEKTFFGVPLAHSERPDLHHRCVRLMGALVEEAPEHLRAIYRFSASQACGHRDVIVRFGRHPHRNAVLDRPSTLDELAFMASGVPVHRREIRL